MSSALQRWQRLHPTWALSHLRSGYTGLTININNNNKWGARTYKSKPLHERSWDPTPRPGYFPPYDAPTREDLAPPALGHRTIECFVREDRRAILRRVRRAQGWIPGFLQGRGIVPDVLLRVPVAPLLEDYNAGLFVLQKRGKVKFMGPLYNLNIININNNNNTITTVRAQPMNMLVHPITEIPVGLNFVLRPEERPVRVRIPVRYINEEKCTGLKMAGWINGLHRAVDVNVAPGVLPPTFATQDVAGVKLHGRVTIGQLDFERKNQGCRTVLPDDEVCTIISKC